MEQLNGFQVADGSVVGRSHVGRGKVFVGGSNQDALAWRQLDNAVVAVVCDGCGSAPFSEFGARLGALSFVAAAQQFLTVDISTEDLLDLSFVRVLSTVKNAAHSFLPNSFTATDDEIAAVVHNYLLFTMVGMVIRPSFTHIFSIGDGFYAINGQPYTILPNDGNMPPYIAYNIVPPTDMAPVQYTNFCIQERLPTEEANSLLIGTDGVVDLAQSVERNIPGKNELVGPLSQFWEDDRYFKNRAAIDRRLHLINREVHRIVNGRLEYQGGLLADDATFVVVRRVS